MVAEAPVLISGLCGKSSELLSTVSSLEHWALHLKAVANPMRRSPKIIEHLEHFIFRLWICFCPASN
jgi:hypothetical protein